jgi:hypothetical protein
MKLYVDDLRKCPEGWTLARTNTEAIRLLASGYVDEISIDHDICVANFGQISVPLRRRLSIGEETFQPVAYYIAAMKPEDRPKKITLHSANPAGVLRMKGILLDAGIEAGDKESTCEFDLGENEA